VPNTGAQPLQTSIEETAKPGAQTLIIQDPADLFESGPKGHQAGLDPYMDALAECRSESSRHARERLVELLREHALMIGEVALTSGRAAQYYVDAKRAILLPQGFMALGLLVAEQRLGSGLDPLPLAGAGG
jgi:hypothetical protein